MDRLRFFFDWSEVWAPIIPLLVLPLRPKQPVFLRPVIIYLFAGIFINLASDIIADYKKYFPSWLQSNTVLYNIHSIVRFGCFSSFFILLTQTFYSSQKKILPLFYLVFLLINFTFSEKFFNPNSLSGNLLAAEAFLLLIYCLLYYLSQLKDDVEVLTSGAGFWVVTGISIYVVINFYVFLFYVPMLTENMRLADNMWDIHDVAYIILCIFIAKAFYEPVRNYARI